MEMSTAGPLRMAEDLQQLLVCDAAFQTEFCDVPYRAGWVFYFGKCLHSLNAFSSDFLPSLLPCAPLRGFHQQKTMLKHFWDRSETATSHLVGLSGHDQLQKSRQRQNALSVFSGLHKIGQDW